MNGIAVRVGRIKGGCLGDMTCTAVNYWVLVVRWTRSQIRGTAPPHSMNLQRLSPALVIMLTFLLKTRQDMLFIIFDRGLKERDASECAKASGPSLIPQNS